MRRAACGRGPLRRLLQQKAQVWVAPKAGAKVAVAVPCRVLSSVCPCRSKGRREKNLSGRSSLPARREKRDTHAPLGVPDASAEQEGKKDEEEL